MNKKFRVACIQLNAGSDSEKNWQRLSLLLEKAGHLKCHLIALPEVFAWRGPSKSLNRIANYVSPLIIGRLQSWAKKSKTALLLGSVLLPAKTRGKVTNTSLLINVKGKILAAYHKIHLFDINCGNIKSRETKEVQPGTKVVSVKMGDKLFGLSVCYDLRFPELYRSLAKKGVQIIFVPANFTAYTGKAHWEVLLRARAIENQVFIVAPAQTGVHPGNKIKSYGNSLIVDPWGRILARGSHLGEEVLWTDLDFLAQKKLRKQFPVLNHRRL